tara:strand:+ start:2083 stop:2265 length:183 start_codon:yes stop_codon:yes gene_type:complete
MTDEDNLKTVWDALGQWADDDLTVSYEQWADVCTAMANIREAMGLPSEAEMDHEGEKSGS